MPDLLNDRMVVWVDRYYYALWVPLSLAIPAAIGGLVTLSWTGVVVGLLWGGLARIFPVHHVSFSINSICHVFGSREFHSADNSRNNFLCGLLGHGEGWHNNYHALPTSARHGLYWWQVDLSWLAIRTLQLVGLAWNVKLPGRHAIASKRLT